MGANLAGQLAQVPNQEQVGEVADGGRQRLQVLDGLAPACGVRRAKRRPDDRLDQRGLAVRRGAQDLEVPAPHAEAGELRRRLDDLAVALGVELPPIGDLGLEQAPLLQLPDQLGPGAGLLHQVLDLEQPSLAGVDAHRPAQRGGAALPALSAARRKLLADHAEGQELVALEPQDLAQPLDVRLAVEAVAPGRAPGREQLLVLEVPDLGDGDVLELAAEDLGDGADRQRLARRGSILGGLHSLGWCPGGLHYFSR